MKTTIEIPDALYRRARAAAATEGIRLKALVCEALDRHLRGQTEAPAWRALAGRLADLRKESAAIDRIVLAEFEHVEDEEP